MRADEIRQALATVQTLDTVVASLRALAAMRIRRTLDAAGAADRYIEELERTVAATAAWFPALAHPAHPTHPGRATRLGIIVVGAEHGFVGGYHHQLLAAAADPAVAPAWCYVLGSRLARLAARQALPHDGWMRMATRADGVTATMLALVDVVWPAWEAGRFTRLDLIAARHAHGRTTIVREPVLPLAQLPAGLAPGRARPRLHLPPARLAQVLLATLVQARLIGVLLQALGAENEARVQAMERAREHLGERQQSLQRDGNALAQEIQTNEILEQVASEPTSG